MNMVSKIDEFEIPDYEDGSKLKIIVNSCSELGNSAKPGLQFFFMGSFVNYEPKIAEKWRYELNKASSEELLLQDKSWMPNEENFIKVFFVNSTPAMAKIMIKTRSSEVISKQYELPF